MYGENSSATAGGTSAQLQNLNYPNHRNPADSAATGGENRIVRTLSAQQQQSQSQQMPRT